MPSGNGVARDYPGTLPVNKSERNFRRMDPPAVQGEKINRKPTLRPTLHVWCGSPCPIRQSLGRTQPKEARRCQGREGGEIARQRRDAEPLPLTIGRTSRAVPAEQTR